MVRFVLLRVRAHRLLLAAAALTVLLTSCVLAALGAFSGAIGDGGVRRTLGHQSAARTLLEVQADVTGVDRDRLDTVVRRAVSHAYDGLPVSVAASTRSGPYGLPRGRGAGGDPSAGGSPAAGGDPSAGGSPAAAGDSSASGDPDLTLLATFDASRVTMVEGTTPGKSAPHGGSSGDATGAHGGKAAARGGRAAPPPVPVALPENAARALGLRTGDRVTLADRLGGGPPLTVRLTGLYRPADRDALYWRLDPLNGRGVSVLDFTTYGPMLADPSAFSSGRVAPAAMAWQARADFSAMTAARIGALRDSVRRAVARIGDDPAGGAARVSTDLPGLLSEVERSLLVSRSTVLIGALPLAVLAGLSLLLVARALTEERAAERALLQARGGSYGRLVALAATEALLLAVPAAVASVLLAGPLIRLLTWQGALARGGLRLPVSGAPSAAVWAAAVATVLVCTLAMTGPALRRPGTYVAERAARFRRQVLPAAARVGADLGLLLVAGLAYWQLAGRAPDNGVLSADGGGTLGLDPVLVAAPPACLLAGTVLALRLLPPAARFAERRAARGRGLAPALAGWQLARRPGRLAGPVLLLVLTVAMGVIAVGQGASWDRSQRDQANYAVGADIRVTGSRTPPFGQGGLYDALPGVAAAAPAARTDVPLDRNRLATLIALDTTHAADIVRLRPDQADRPLRELLAPLAPPGPSRDDAGPGSADPAPEGAGAAAPHAESGPAGGGAGGPAPRTASEPGGGSASQTGPRPDTGSGPQPAYLPRAAVTEPVRAAAPGNFAYGSPASQDSAYADSRPSPSGADDSGPGAHESRQPTGAGWRAEGPQQVSDGRESGTRQHAGTTHTREPLGKYGTAHGPATGPEPVSGYGPRYGPGPAAPAYRGAASPAVSARWAGAPARAADPRGGAFVVPDGARQVRVSARLAVEGAGQGGGRRTAAAGRDSLTAVVTDRYGVPYSFDLGDLQADGRVHALTLDIAAAAGPGGRPAGPLRLTELTVRYPLPTEPAQHRLTVTALRAALADGSTAAVPVPASAHSAWNAEATVDDPDFVASPDRGSADARAHPPTVGRGGDVLTVRYDTGAAPPDPTAYEPTEGRLTLRAGTPPAPALSGVATDAFLRAAGTKVGGTTQVAVAGTDLTVRITGSVRTLPTTPADASDTNGGALLTDLDMVNRALAENAGHATVGLQPGEWWLEARPGAERRVAAALRERTDDTSLLARSEQARELSADPLGAGPRSALPALAVAAAVLAAAGFAVATAGALRERSDEFALLRALGAPRRRIVRAVGTEQGALVLVAVAMGAALGALLTHLVVPLIVLTAQAAHPTPGVVVELPPALLVPPLLAALAVPLLVAAATAARRDDPVRALRGGTT